MRSELGYGERKASFCKLQNQKRAKNQKRANVFCAENRAAGQAEAMAADARAMVARAAEARAM